MLFKSTTIKGKLEEAKAEVERLKKMARCKREPIPGWIGGVIQSDRERKGWTLHELADKSGVSVGLLSRIESNIKANPTLENLLKICKALDTPLSSMAYAWEEQMMMLPREKEAK